MGNPAEIIDSKGPTSGAQEAIATQVQKALSETLKSTPFRTSKQSQQLLKYIVDKTLAGHAEFLKERVIGAEVFGRPPDYDTNEDPIVRGRAAEVRKRLAQYYMREGQLCSIRIEISPGSYLASFSDSSTPNAKESGVSESNPIRPQEKGLFQQIEPSKPVTGRESLRVVDLNSKAWRFLGTAVLVVLLGTVSYMLRPKNPVAQFWSPLSRQRSLF